MTSATHLVQTETPVNSPAEVAKQIVAILVAAREGGHDQETTRVALHSFSSAMQQHPPGLMPKPY